MFTHREAFAHSKLLQRKAFAHRSFYTQQAFTQRSPNTEKHWHRGSFTHSSLYTQSFYTQQSNRTTRNNATCRDWVANTIELRATASEIAAPKPDGSRRQSEKKTLLKHFAKGLLKGKLLAPKLRKSADKSLSQPWCSHSNTIYDVQLQKRIALRTQLRCQATLTQPLQCVLQHHVANLHVSTQVAASDDDNHAAIPQCDLQPQIQETQRTTHTGTTTCCRTQRRNQNDRSRNRRTHEVPFIAGCSHFTRKNTRFRAPASSPKHSPCNIHAAIPQRSATTDSRNA